MKVAPAVTFVCVVLVVGGLVAVSAQYTSPSTAIRPSSSLGLKFTMSLNATSVRLGHDLGAMVDLVNTLDRVNNVTAVVNWRISNESLAGCDMSKGVFGIEVVRGYYDINNFTKGMPIRITIFLPPLGFNQCLLYSRAANETAEPLFVSYYGTNYYVFKPSSDVAQWITSGVYNPPNPHPLPNATGSCNPCDNVNQLAVMNETFLLRPALFTNSTGVFTVICGDLWGDLAVSHFTVT